MEAALGEGRLDGLVIEITEHDAVGDYARLAPLADYRGRGARVARRRRRRPRLDAPRAQLSPDYIRSTAR